MRSLIRLSTFGVFLLVCVVGTASAQSLRITTDNPTDNTVLNPSGTTLLTITLNPDFDSVYGYVVSCNWALCYTQLGAFCGIVTVPELCDNHFPLRVAAYDIILSAVGGTVTWGTFYPPDDPFLGLGWQTATSTQVEFAYLRRYPDYGPFTLGTIPVTASSPLTTSIVVVRHDASHYGTNLSMDNCGGVAGGPYLLGDRANPCAYGPTDWYEAFGAISPEDACLAKANHGQCEVCCKEEMGGTASTCTKFCFEINKGTPGEPQP